MDTTKRHIYTIFTVTIVLAVVVAGTSAGALSAIGDSTAQTTGNMGEADLKLEPVNDTVQTGQEERFNLVLTGVPEGAENFRSVRVTFSVSGGSPLQFENSSNVIRFAPPSTSNTYTLAAESNVTSAETPFVLGQLPVVFFSPGEATIQIQTTCPDTQQSECLDGAGDPIFPTSSDLTVQVESST